MQHPRQNIISRPRRDHQSSDQPQEPRHSHDRPQLRLLAEPHRELHIGLPQVELSKLPRPIPSPLRRIRKSKQRPQSATRSRSTVIPLVQPIRSAITVAGISGTSLNSARISGSIASTIEPCGDRSYFGGASERNADRTVFLATPPVSGRSPFVGFTHIGAGSNPEVVTSAAVANGYSSFKTRNRLGGRRNILEREIQHDKDRPTSHVAWRVKPAVGGLSVHVPPVLTAVAVAI